MVAGFGWCSERFPAGRRRGRSSSAPSPCWPSSGSSRAPCGGGARPRYAAGLELQQERVPAPHGALGQRVELALPADGPYYSYEGDCVSFGWAVVVRRVGEKRVAELVPLWVAP
jgi:hypothetical protein